MLTQDLLKHDLQIKYNHLKETIRSYSSVIIGFSGGVDSSLLAKVSFDELKEKSLAVIGKSPSYPSREEDLAIDLANKIGIKYQIINTEELNNESYLKNQGDRCYYCKSELYSKLTQIKKDLNYTAILDGTNISDLRDIRPGLKATEELEIKKPLIDCNFTKEDIRNLSRYLGLPNWDKPSFACLSSRFPIGSFITIDGLNRIDKGEQVLYDMGFRQFRLRYHGDLARIELLEKDFQLIVDNHLRNRITTSLSELGFRYITIDLRPYIEIKQ